MAFDLFTVDLGHAARSGPSRSDSDLNLGSLAEDVSVHRLRALPRARLGALSEPARGLDILLQRRLHRRVAEVINRGGYDIALVHHDHLLGAPALLEHVACPTLFYLQEPRRQAYEWSLMRAHRRPKGWRLGPWAVEVAFDAWARRADARSVRSADHIAVNSAYSAESVARAYGRWPTVCELGVDPAVFQPEESGVRDDHVLMVGTLDPVKRQDLAVRALAHIPTARRPRLVLVHNRETDRFGDALRALARELGVELELVRDVSDEDLAVLYSRAAAVLCLGQLEPFGLTSIEALACGTPVVAVAEGGYRETVVDHRNGRLVAPRPGAVAEGVDDVLTWTVDRRELRRSVLPRFSWEAAAARLQAIVHEMLAESPT